MPVESLELCIEGLKRHFKGMLRGIVGQGLYLLKASAHYARPVESRNQGRKSNATVALDFPAEENPGFDQWIAENLKEFEISRRSAYNYMAAARFMGLTAESTEEDLEGLRFVQGLRAVDLYKGALDGPKKTDALPPVTADQAASELWFPFFSSLDEYSQPEGHTAQALWKLPVVDADPSKPSLAALKLKLETTLDVIREVEEQRKKNQKSNRG